MIKSRSEMWCLLIFFAKINPGANCETDIDECSDNPCLNGGSCVDLVNGFKCVCAPTYLGRNCETTFDPCTTNQCKNYSNDASFSQKGLNGLLGMDPWANCTSPCWEHFMNGECNENCNIEACLFDGWDCERPLQKCNPVYNTYCLKHYANEQCDHGCNSPECNWDGLDCANEDPDIVDGHVSIIILMNMKEFEENSVNFLRNVGHVLRTSVSIKKDVGKDMLYHWNGSAEYRKDKIIDGAEQRQSGVEVYLEIDNRKCVSKCFHSVGGAANFLAATSNKLSEFPIYRIVI